MCCCNPCIAIYCTNGPTDRTNKSNIKKTASIAAGKRHWMHLILLWLPAVFLWLQLSDLVRQNDKRIGQWLCGWLWIYALYSTQDRPNRPHLAATCIMQSVASALHCMRFVLWFGLFWCWKDEGPSIKDGGKRYVHGYRCRHDDDNDNDVVNDDDDDNNNKNAHTTKMKKNSNNNNNETNNSEKLTRISENSKPTSKYFFSLSRYLRSFYSVFVLFCILL